MKAWGIILMVAIVLALVTFTVTGFLLGVRYQAEHTKIEIQMLPTGNGIED